jgi:hypothetical protein
MKGHVRERGKGNWYAVLDVRDPRTGKRKRKWHSLEAKGKRETQIECATLINAITAGSGFRLGWHRAESRCEVLVKPMPSQREEEHR